MSNLGYIQMSLKDPLLSVSLICHLASIILCVLIFSETLALYKSFTYLLTYLLTYVTIRALRRVLHKKLYAFFTLLVTWRIYDKAEKRTRIAWMDAVDPLDRTDDVCWQCLSHAHLIALRSVVQLHVQLDRCRHSQRVHGYLQPAQFILPRQCTNTLLFLVCGRPSKRQYGSCPSVRPSDRLSVCLRDESDPFSLEGSWQGRARHARGTQACIGIWRQSP